MSYLILSYPDYNAYPLFYPEEVSIKFYMSCRRPGYISRPMLTLILPKRVSGLTAIAGRYQPVQRHRQFRRTPAPTRITDTSCIFVSIGNEYAAFRRTPPTSAAKVFYRLSLLIWHITHCLFHLLRYLPTSLYSLCRYA